MPIQVDAGADAAIRNVLGNTLIANADLPAGTNKVIGSVTDVANSRAIFFLWNSGNNHTIYLINFDLTITRVMRWSGLNFNTAFLVNESYILGDLLIWTDNFNPARQINILKGVSTEGDLTVAVWSVSTPYVIGNKVRLILGSSWKYYICTANNVAHPPNVFPSQWTLLPQTSVIYYTPTNDEISLIKRGPIAALICKGSQDLAFIQNFIYGNSFQFYYQYIYEDNQASVWSAFANVPQDTSVYPLKDQNVILITRQIGGSNPQQELIPKSVKQINYAFRMNQTDLVQLFFSEFAPFALSGTTGIVFHNNVIGETVPDNQSFKWNDDVPLLTKALTINKNRLFLFNNLEGYDLSPAPLAGFNVSVQAITTNPELLQFKHRGSYQVGIMFFDNAGRNAGVQIGSQYIVTIPDQDRQGLPAYDRYTIAWDIIGIENNLLIPAWATSYAIVRTKINNIASFIQDFTPDIFYYQLDPGTSAMTYSHSSTTANNKGLAIDISPLIRYKMGYTFNAGDHIRLYSGGGTTPTLDAEIKGQDGKFVLIDLPQNFPISPGPILNAKFYEIYTPRQVSVDEPFYEVGSKYAIITTTFVFSGVTTIVKTFSVSSGKLTGDTSIASADDRPTHYFYQPAGYSDTMPYSNVIQDPPIISEFGNFEAMNALSRFFNIWTEQTGRPMVRSIVGSIQYKKSHYIRFGQPYLFDSSVNGINTFEALDEYPLPIENGAGTGLKVNDRVIVAIHQKDCTAVYIGEGFVNTSDANVFLAKTDNVISQDNKYIGGFGSYHAESIVSYGDRTYFYDIFKGAICRRTTAGVFPISSYGITNFLKAISISYLASKDTMRFYGGYDPRLDLYLLSVKDAAENLLYCLAFHEPSNAWIGFFDYPAENFSYINNILLSFKAGAPWIHNNPTRNNFFGVQYARDMEFNIGGAKVKRWDGIEIDADDIYTHTDGQNEVIVTATDNGSGFIISGPGGQLTTVNYLDFIKREGVWRSAIFRDTNTPKPFDDLTQAKFEGNRMRSQMLKVKVKSNRVDASAMRGITVLFTPSEISYP